MRGSKQGTANMKCKKNTHTVSRSDIVRAVAANKKGAYVFTQKQVDIVIIAVLNEIIENVCNGNRVIIKGFGSFKMTQRKGRQYVTPLKQTCETSVTNKLVFEPSSRIKKLLNE